MLSLLALRYPRFSSVNGVYGLVHHQRNYAVRIIRLLIDSYAQYLTVMYTDRSAEAPKPVHQWTALDPQTWLRKKGLEKHIPMLQGFTGYNLLAVSKPDLAVELSMGPEDATVFWRLLQQAKSGPY